jgi:hypothetical protein
VNVVQIANGF